MRTIDRDIAVRLAAMIQELRTIERNLVVQQTVKAAMNDAALSLQEAIDSFPVSK